MGGLLGASVAAPLSALQPLLFAAEPSAGSLEAGQGVVDITPPLGIEMAGFHRPADNPRLITAIRQPSAVRALILRSGGWRAALISLDLVAVSAEFTRRVQTRVADETGIPAQDVRVTVTHTHSMPSFCYLRQWGAIPEAYLADVEKKAIEAVMRARTDLAPACLSVGTSLAPGASFNRTSKSWKNEEHFDQTSTEADRWLDRRLHVLHFERSQGDLLWYHFSAHPVCYADDLAGPDWPGLVDRRLHQEQSISASYLQGHAGDVNPGAGDPWRGDAEKTSDAVHAAVVRAIETGQRIDCRAHRSQTVSFDVPFDLERFRAWVDLYRQDPAKCTSGEWVDAGFAQDWYEKNHRRDVGSLRLDVPLSVIQIGDLALVFHPSELYSYYGLVIQRDIPLSHTVAVGYTDGLIGYLTDPAAYRNSEYAAIVVPKILDLPPFREQAARQMTERIVQLVKETVSEAGPGG